MVSAIFGLLSGGVGFVGRYLPDMVKGHFEAKREEKTLAMSLEIEKVKAASSKEIKQFDNDALVAVNSLQLEMSAITQEFKNIGSARSFSKHAVSMMDKTLSKATELSIYPWMKNLCFFLVMGVEIISASIQPLIAVCVFAMWSWCKIKQTGEIAFTVEDWMLLDAIVGFYLAGRVQKHKSIK